MSYLIDTHVVLWWFDDPEKLSEQTRGIIRNKDSHIFVSSVSTWEISIKHSLGKLRISGDIWSLIEQNFSELPMTIAHTKKLLELKLHHTDPFDRILIAQAKADNLILLTRDPIFKKYNVPLIPA
jgi:PIN domain nuclease of toxin-antitoxin system